MQHQDTRVFLNHYLSRRVTVDTAAIVRGLAPQDELMEAACRMSRWIDPARPWKLTPEQSAAVNAEPRVAKLIQRRAQQKRQGVHQARLGELSRRINNEKQRLRNERLAEIRAKWDAEQAVETIERQLAGLDFAEEVKSKLGQSEDYRRPEHQNLISALMSLPGSTLEEEDDRRTTAIVAVMEYCAVEEAEPVRPCLPHGRVGSGVTARPTSRPDDVLQQRFETARLAVYSERRPVHCFVCLANEALPLDKRTAPFSSPGDLSKHFKRRHIAHIGEADKVSCDLCQVSLFGVMHVQSHALRIHGTVS